MKKIGFIGLGLMGTPLAINLIKAGYSMVVWNRTRSKMSTLLLAGAESSDSIKELTKRCDIIITMVSDSPDVEEIALGPCGLLESDSSGKIFIDMSTISPQVTRRIAEKLLKKGVKMLDAPVSGGTIGAKEGTLSIMVGGARETFEECRPIFRALGRRIIYMGENGMGQAAKLCNQIICAINIQSVCEGLMLGSKLGLDLDKLLEIVAGGAANSWMVSNLGPKMIKRDFKPGFKISHQLKDLRLALSAATELGLPLPCSALVQQFFYAIEAEGMKDKGTQALIITMEKLASMKIK